jgi:hypothetical protein
VHIACQLFCSLDVRRSCLWNREKDTPNGQLRKRIFAFTLTSVPSHPRHNHTSFLRISLKGILLISKHPNNNWFRSHRPHIQSHERLRTTFLYRLSVELVAHTRIVLKGDQNFGLTILGETMCFLYISVPSQLELFSNEWQSFFPKLYTNSQ